nr:nucleotide exchange factor GrpE [Lottiidibacillus patelloidae]
MENVDKTTTNDVQNNDTEEVTNEEVVQGEVVTEDETTEELTTEQKKIIDLESKVDELNNRVLRTQADFDNYRRRAKIEQETAAKYRAQSLVEEIIPALDNFERALAVQIDNEQGKTLLQGMEMVYRQLVEALSKEGVTEIEALGQQFDPHMHQAVMQVEDESHESNSVVEVLQKGYKLKDRVIRPAMVKVNA